MNMQGWPGIAYRPGALSSIFVVHLLKGLETILEAARVISDVALSSRHLNEQGGIYILEWQSQSGRGRLLLALVSVGDKTAR